MKKMGETCVFCKIVRGEESAERVYEDESVLAFLDIKPITLGHTLVVPKKHNQDLFEIPKKELGKIAKATKKVAEGLRRSLDAKGVNILHSSGSVAQQEVPHFHIHVIPRYKRDEINIFPGRVGTKESLEKVAKKIRNTVYND